MMSDPVLRPGLDDAEVLQLMRDASIETAVQQLRLIHELKQQRGIRPDSQRHPQPEGRVTPGLEDFMFDLARLSVTSYDQWLKLTSKHFPEIVGALRQVSGRPASAPLMPAPLGVTISGRFGSMATSTIFCVENPSDVDVIISFTRPEVQEIGARATGVPISQDCAITFQVTRRDGTPTNTTIKPGQSYVLPQLAKTYFCVSVMLDVPFETHRRYVGTGRVLSAGRVIGIVKMDLTVE